MAGSRKGVPNKNKNGLKARLSREFDLDVMDEMAKIIMERGSDGEFVQTQEVRFNQLSRLAPYVESQLKALEVIAEIEANVEYGWEKPKK